LDGDPEHLEEAEVKPGNNEDIFKRRTRDLCAAKDLYMRLLILTPEYSGAGGGIMTFYRSLVPALCAAGVDVHVVEGSAFLNAPGGDERLADGVHVELLDRDRLTFWWDCFSFLEAAPGLRRHLAAAWAVWQQAKFGEHADVVEASDWGLLFVPPALESKRPLVVQCHGSIGQIADHDPIAGEETEALLVKLIEKIVLSCVGTIQTSSQSNAAFWNAESCQSITTIRPTWSRLAVESSQIGDRGLVIGRLQRWKGCDTLCAALRHLTPAAPPIDWFGRDTVWGNRNQPTSRWLAETFPDVWNAKLVHHEQILPDEVTRRQSSALFNLVPSTWDVFNFTAVESMASGRPTIVSTGAGAAELIEDGVNGFVFPGHDSKALAETIQRVVGLQPSKLAEIGRAGRDTVDKELAPEAITWRRLDAYRAAISAFNARRPTPVNGWIGAACRPAAAPVGNGMTFLNNFPIKALGKHVVHRISRKVLWR
jgi:glycosyltransferase involved in cell wall biosynthesis